MQNAIISRAFTATIQGLAFMALSASAVMTGGATAFAQTPPTMVQNVDEPARNPFQQTVFISAGCSGPCDVVFSKVPASKLLRITYVSCWFQVGDTNGVRLVYLSNGELTPKYAFISGVAQGDPSYVVAAAQINLY